MNELPKVFQNNINNNANTNNRFYYSKNKPTLERQDIHKKINDIFSMPNYVYKANVKIVLENETIEKKIIGRNKDYIITMDSKLIPIKDIIDIEIKKSS